MKESIKANLIIFFIIATISFCISTSFANLTVEPETESYKLISIQNDSFEPNYIEEVPTIIEPKNITNTTNSTNNTLNYTNTYENYTNYTQNYVDTNNYIETITAWE